MNNTISQHVLIEGQSAAVISDHIEKKRTLLIGVGGSGKEVIMRFRRKLNEMYDGLGRHPYIEYLWLDTDSRNKSIRNVEWDKSFANAQLSSSQIIDASMDTNELQSFYDNFNQFSNYHHWFNYDALKGMGSQVLSQGASAMRPFGKLAFWKHSRKIEAKIADAVKRLKNPNFNINNLSSANDIDVYVIASLAGGTGSGMLIDTAVMLQKVDPNLNPTGIFFLSDVFAHDSASPVGGNQEERDANCFATLQELDFYMTPENQSVRDENPSLFDFNWSPSQEHSIKLPIYKKLNLVSNNYENGEIEPSLEEAFNIVAEYLIMGYNDTNFDADIRSARTNVIKGYNNRMHFINVISTGNKNYNVTTPYSTTYTGLGLGLIEFNKKRIKNWAKYQFLANFLTGLEKQNNIDTALYKDDQNKPKSDYLDPDIVWNRLETGKTGESPIDEIMKLMRKERHNLLEEILSWPDIRNVNIDKMESVRNRIDETISNFFEEKRQSMLKETREDANYKGQVITKLNNYRDIVFDDIPREIKKQYYRVLEATNRDGISSAAGFIEEVKTNIYSVLRDYLNEKKPQEKVHRAPEGFELPNIDGVSKINRYAQDTEDIPKLFFGYGSKAKRYYTSKRDNARESYRNNLRRSIESYVGDYEKYLKDLLESNYYTILTDNFREVTNIINSSLDDLQNEEHLNIMRNLERWSRNYEDYSRAFGFQDRNVAKRKFVLDNYLQTEIKNEFNEIIKRESEANYQNFLLLVQEQLATKIGPLLNEDELGESAETFFVYALANYHNILQNHGLDLFALLDSCASEFLENRRFLDGRTVASELLKLLNSSNAASDAEMGIKKSFDQSCMRLNFINHPTVRENMDREFISKNGISDKASAALTDRIKQILGQEVGFNHSNMEEEIVFYQEGSGFPLVALSQINNLRERFYNDIRNDPNKIYQRYTTKDYEYLRTLKNMNDSEFNRFSGYYRDAMKAVLLGIITYEKIELNNNQHEWRFLYRYSDKGVAKTKDMLKQIESIADIMSMPASLDTHERIVQESNLNELTVVELVNLVGAITLNLNALQDNKTPEDTLSMGQWALMEIRDMFEAQIRQKVVENYPTEEEMDKFINEIYERQHNPEDYHRLNYYTSEFNRGILVMKRGN
ncbi:MAG: tubulin-like doman-containing protein [Candidatus Cloacimonadaceae bacterium]